MMEFNLNKILEALLLSTAEPIALNDLVKVFDRHRQKVIESAESLGNPDEGDASRIEGPAPVTKSQIAEALKALASEAEVEDKSYRIVERANGFQIVTAARFAEWVRLFRGEPRPKRLGPAALETMSIVAYRQPVTRAEIEAIRGVSVDGPLNRLIALELVHVTGRAQLPGRPIQYCTTDRFLEFTGIRALEDLPASDVLSNHEIDNWMQRETDDGLTQPPEAHELPLGQEFEEINWQAENAESDVADGLVDAEETT